jgi:hypothetical protein
MVTYATMEALSILNMCFRMNFSEDDKIA